MVDDRMRGYRGEQNLGLRRERACMRPQHTTGFEMGFMEWTRELPTKGGRYKHKRNGIERFYWLCEIGFTHSCMPDKIWLESLPITGRAG